MALQTSGHEVNVAQEGGCIHSMKEECHGANQYLTLVLSSRSPQSDPTE